MDAEWLFVEESHAWAPKILKSAVDAQLLTAMQDYRDASGARLQFIRKPCSQTPEGSPRRVFRGRPGELAEAVWRPGESFESLDYRPLRAAHYFVCTHGKRDACCALRGIAFYKALVDAAEDDAHIWQTSHIGGHRFAATLVTFPSGYVLGRLEPYEASALLMGEGFHALEKVRGRVGDSPPEQVADIALRNLSPTCKTRPEFTLEAHSELEYSVRSHIANLSLKKLAGPLAQLSCGDETKATARWEIEVAS